MGTLTALTTRCDSAKLKYTGFCLLALCIGLYAIIIHLVLHFQLSLDFSSFYASAQALHQGHNPYLNLRADFLPNTPLLSPNLNPPLFLLIFSSVSYLNYETALFVWMTISFIMEFLGVFIIVKLAFPRPFQKQYWSYLLSMSLLFYAMIANTAIAQVGTLLLFFIMAGYLCYKHHHDTLAGILWGFIIAIKFFPALLFFLVLSEKRYLVFGVMLLTVLVLSLVPWVAYGTTIYQYYFKMLPQVLWYGDSWNTSIYGLLFRCWINLHSWTYHHIKPVNLPIVNTVYVVLFSFTLIVYWYLLKKKYNCSPTPRTSSRVCEGSPKLSGDPSHARDDVRVVAKKSNNPHQAMCLTLTVMLLLSPFGWLYYFPLLLFPLVITWQAYSQNLPQNSLYFLMYLICFILLNMPLEYTTTLTMHSWIDKSSIYSVYFYGLLMLTYLCSNIPALKHPIEQSQQRIQDATRLPILLILLTTAFWPALGAIRLYLQS